MKISSKHSPDMITVKFMMIIFYSKSRAKEDDRSDRWNIMLGEKEKKEITQTTLKENILIKKRQKKQEKKERRILIFLAREVDRLF